MCIGRVDQYHCGCYTDPKVFRCEPAQKKKPCDGIGPLITANILSFCDVCMERRKNNTLELKRIIDESRKIADAKAEAKVDAIRAAEHQAAIDAIDINTLFTGRLSGRNATDGDETTGIGLAGVSSSPGDEKDRNFSLTDGSQKDVAEKGEVEHTVNQANDNEQLQPACSSKFAKVANKVFCGCFKKG
ncbi:hypothetical protein ONS95_008636 [Cadophora gregata]|uniref:uncharacterized protein n=1 Tax=Cadophora gregata TaxID=51156 RepID=UPI0026DBEA6E|nr:uncharacterized protein ONS95_008636 [Cadophora gregata]KAK0123620.1 hypothetical protein ONS95_008636 [Cadophora gregata]